MKITITMMIAAALAGFGLSMAPSADAAVDTVTTPADSGPGSLRNTIAAAGSGDTIVFSPALGGQTIQLTSGELSIGQDLTIDASAVGGVIIDAGGSSRVFEIGNANVIFNSLTVANGYANGDTGGGVLLDEPVTSLTAMNCVFIGNSAEFGGGISAYGTLTLDNSMVSNNVANVYGGGIFCSGGGVMLNNSTLTGNSVSDGGGGGIESEFCALTLNNCTVSGNFATIFAGGIDSEDDGSLVATNCVFLCNSSGTGGAISAETPLATLSECTFSNNISTNGAGGAIVNFQTMALNNCFLAANSTPTYNGEGGGLFNSGTLAMDNCSFSGNSTGGGSGAGLYNTGTLTATNCTWSGNSGAESGGGGIYNYGMLTLDNCTLSGNSATNSSGGGLASVVATNVLVNCTICSNSADLGGGISSDSFSTVALTNTIVAGNIALSGANDVAGNHSGTANFIGGNPQLAALGNYGGPTPTMPPLPGSSVIDAGTDSVTNFLATDQRGYPRLSGLHVDIGAVEARVFVVLNANDDGIGSLRAALTNSPDFVTFTNTLAGQTIYLTNGELLAGNTMTIDASALQGGVIIDAGKHSRVIEITNATVTLNSLTLTDGVIASGFPEAVGGAVLVNSGCALNAITCIFSDNYSSMSGGGIENLGTVALSHCILSGNTASFGTGGGIDFGPFIDSGSATLNDCTISGNSANEGGGGIFIYDGALSLSNCALFNNSGREGGGIDCGGPALLALNYSTFTSNSAVSFGNGRGGGVEGGILSATNCAFSANSADGGGAIDGIGGTLSLCIISNNVAQFGAGIMNESGTLDLYSCTFAANTATNGPGGAITSGGVLTANDCNFFGNIATNGGAIVNAFNMTLNNCNVSGNSVTNGDGGGIYNYEMLEVSNCTFAVNTAVNGNGGAIYSDFDGSSTLLLANTILNANTAGGYGGGIANGGILTANNCSVFGNVATNGGGFFNALSMTLNNCTLCANFATAGSGGAIYSDSAYAIDEAYATDFLVNCTVSGNDANDGSAGGIYNDSSSTLALTNTIVAGNSAVADNDVYGVYSGVANFIGGNPQLAGLGSYGGPMLTRPPMFRSPVIDAGTDWVTNILTTDQRGYPRLAGAHVDIGAVESQIAPASNPPFLSNTAYFRNGNVPAGSFRFTFTNAVYADFTVLSSTNLALPFAQWTVLGNAVTGLPGHGQYEYEEPPPPIFGTNNPVATPHRFYRVVSP